MALTATIYNFSIELADMDRGVYETLDLKVAQHPSETDESLITRVFAYCREYTEGIGFSKGISTPDEPAVFVRDLTGVLRTWIDIGSPDAARIHRASKAADRVVVYTHKDPKQMLANWEGERIHKAESIEVFSFDAAFLAALVRRLERRMAFSLSITDAHLYVAFGDETIDGAIRRHEAGGTPHPRPTAVQSLLCRSIYSPRCCCCFNPRPAGARRPPPPDSRRPRCMN